MFKQTVISFIFLNGSSLGNKTMIRWFFEKAFKFFLTKSIYLFKYNIKYKTSWTWTVFGIFFEFLWIIWCAIHCTRYCSNNFSFAKVFRKHKLQLSGFFDVIYKFVKSISKRSVVEDRNGTFFVQTSFIAFSYRARESTSELDKFQWEITGI